MAKKYMENKIVQFIWRKHGFLESICYLNDDIKMFFFFAKNVFVDFKKISLYHESLSLNWNEKNEILMGLGLVWNIERFDGDKA